MSKLFKLKSWLTVDDSAQYLSIAFGEKISALDMLQFVLDKRIKVSISLMNRVPTKPAEILPLPISITQSESCRYVGDGVICKSLDKVCHIEGVLDFPMIGDSKGIVEELFQLLRMGKPMEFSPHPKNDNSKDICVERNGQLYVLHKRNEQYYEVHGNADFGNSDFFLEESDEVLLQKSFDSYIAAQILPPGSLLVFRTDALQEFISTINGVPKSVERPVTNRERTTLLIMIGALAKKAKIDLSNPTQAAGTIEGLTQEFGARVGKSTIENKIKEIAEAVKHRAE